MGKLFEGRLLRNGTRLVQMNGEDLFPDRSLKVRNHSSDGFEWGDGGSGPAQLSLAILLEVFPKDEAVQLYQQFKFGIIAKFDNEWTLTEEQIMGWYGAITRKGSKNAPSRA